MAKHKFKKDQLHEKWWIERSDMVMAGYTYKNKRVFVVCAKNKSEALGSMNAFLERSCE